MNTLIAILTSDKIDKLERCIKSLYQQVDLNDIVVIINALDTQYVKSAEQVCKKYGIRYDITVSNGSPAKGKNSVLDFFLSTEYEYVTQIDGDDYLTPNAISKIHNIIENNPDIDILGLTNNAMTCQGKQYTVQEFFESSDIYSFAGIDGREALNLIALGKFMINHLPCNRMLLYSRRCAESFRFDESFAGAEDIVASYELYYNSTLKYSFTHEHLYNYDLESGGNFNTFLATNTEVKKVHAKLRTVVNASKI
jgi:glycosyltransferase involved in cell wall biosynthesis